jgi:hypothetical protein
MPDRLFLHAALAAIPASDRALTLVHGNVLHLHIQNANKAVATWYALLFDGRFLADANYHNQRDDGARHVYFEVWENPLTVILPDAFLKRLPFDYIGNGLYLRRIKYKLELTPVLRRRLREVCRCEIFK